MKRYEFVYIPDLGCQPQPTHDGKYVAFEEMQLRDDYLITELTACAAEAFRIYHWMDDPEIEPIQYRLAGRLKQLVTSLSEKRKDGCEK